MNRPGTGFINEVKDSTKKVRLIPFVLSNDQTYALEFGDLYMRVHRNGATVLETAKAVTGATQANPCVITVVAHGYVAGDFVVIAGMGGMTQLNGRPQFRVGTVMPDTIELLFPDGSTVNSSAFAAYTSGGTAARIFQIATPYLEADLARINYAQSGDVVTLVHKNYDVRELRRTDHAAWTLAIMPVNPTVGFTSAISVIAGGAGTRIFRYKVVTVGKDATGTEAESLPGVGISSASIMAISLDNPAVVTTSGNHGYTNGDEVHIAISLATSMPEVNARRFVIEVLTPTTYKIGVDSTNYTPYTAGGTSRQTFGITPLSAVPTVAAPHVISWNAVVGARKYVVFKEEFGVYGFIGETGATTFSDTGITGDTLDGPTQYQEPFAESNQNPGAVTYYQQRQVFGNTTARPEGVFTSQVGKRTDFTTHVPLQNDDAVNFNLSGNQVNEVRSLVDVGRLLAFTSGSEWAVNGGAGGSVTPSDINARAYTYNGSGFLRPLIVNGIALFLQERGSIVRDFVFDFGIDGYTGNDLTLFASHLIDGFTITDWAYQKVPNSIVWMVRSDGKMLGLTYIREQEIVGWHQHDMDGTIENVLSIPEGSEDSLYMVVRRPNVGFPSGFKRYIERMKTRVIGDIKDAVFMDSSLSLDGTNVAVTTMTLSGGVTWVAGELLTLTASQAFFTSSDVGNAIHLTGANGDVVRFTITGFTSTTVVTGLAHKTVTVESALRDLPRTTWAKAVDEIGGLWHLEGKRVSVFADGFVIANPNNSDYDVMTVTNGAITLPLPRVKIHVGLPVTADTELLDIDTVQGETLADKKCLIQKVNLWLEKTRGVFVGERLPATDSSLVDLEELKIRDEENYDASVALLTGVADVPIVSTWNRGGRVVVRQSDPLPLSLLAAAPSGFVPFRGA